jgi:hypothetical protein
VVFFEKIKEYSLIFFWSSKNKKRIFFFEKDQRKIIKTKIFFVFGRRTKKEEEERMTEESQPLVFQMKEVKIGDKTFMNPNQSIVDVSWDESDRNRKMVCCAPEVIPANTILLIEKPFLVFRYDHKTKESEGKFRFLFNILKQFQEKRLEPGVLLNIHQLYPRTEHEPIVELTRKNVLRNWCKLYRNWGALSESSKRFAMVWYTKICCNTFELNDKYMGLYQNMSSCNHSCLPNAFVVCDPNEASHEYGRALISNRDIQPGEEITIDYLGDEYPNEKDKLEALEKNYGFVCSCPKHSIL